MFKKIIIGTLAVILVSAAAVGVYDWTRTTPAEAAQADRGGGQPGQGQGWRGGQTAAGNGAPAPASEPQSVPSTAWTTEAGVVQKVDLTGLSVTTEAGQLLWIQLGPNRFWSASITFAAGDPVTVTGFIENGQFMAAKIVNDASGQALTLRNDSGQPLWTGGNGNH